MTIKITNEGDFYVDIEDKINVELAIKNLRELSDYLERFLKEMEEDRIVDRSTLYYKDLAHFIDFG